MATMNFKIQQNVFGFGEVGYVPLVDPGVPDVPRVVQKGVIGTKKGRAPVNLNLYLRSTDSDITGYKDILQTFAGSATTYSGSCTPALTCEVLIEEFATDAGVLDGITVNAAQSWTFAAWYSSPGAESIRRCRVKVYHRTAAGSETLLHEFDKDVNSTQTNWVQSVPINTSWGTNERLVIKAYGYFEIEL